MSDEQNDQAGQDLIEQGRALLSSSKPAKVEADEPTQADLQEAEELIERGRKAVREGVGPQGEVTTTAVDDDEAKLAAGPEGSAV